MTEPSATAKQALRVCIARALSALPPPARAARSGAACARALASDLFPPRSTVLLYAPMLERGEPDLHLLAEGLAARGCRLAVPRVDWAGRTMTAAHVLNLHADLEPDPAYVQGGVRRARPSAPEIPPAEVDVVVVPGMGFDRRGGRIGRGAGFYDRFLSALGDTRPIRVAIAFDEQIVQSMPIEPHDQPMHWIVTPTEIIRR